MARSIEYDAKGSAWAHYDGDGRLDLFVANLDAPSRLYHNEGQGIFRDVAHGLGVAGPTHRRSFACWFWDYDTYRDRRGESHATSVAVDEAASNNARELTISMVS